MKFGTWNVRTLMDNGRSERPERRTALIARELQRHNIDIVALSETRRAGEGQLREEQGGYTFFWKGLEENERRIHGVGFAIKNSVLSKLSELPVGINERLMTLRLQLTNAQHATIVSAYAPTLDADHAVKENFYAQLDSVLSKIPKSDKVFLMGDFNARVGKDSRLWKGTIGRNGIGQCNTNGTLLLTKCTEHNLIITNTIFRQKNKFKVSWQHPRSKHWHLLDYIIVRSHDQKDVLSTKTLTGADDCWTDHRLICSKVRLNIRAKRRFGTKPKIKKYNIAALQDPEKKLQFKQNLTKHLSNQFSSSATTHWEKLKHSINEACRETLGFQTRKHQDWFDENDYQLQQLIAQKRKAFLDLQQDPMSNAKRQTHQKLKAELQRSCRSLKNDWWTNKANEIQALADRNDSRGFFNATKAIFGPSTRGLVPLRSKDGSTMLKTVDEINTRWKDHFEELLNRNPTVNMDEIDMHLPKRETDVNLNEIPSQSEVFSAIKCLKNNKSAGLDNIPAEVFKEGGTVLLNQLHQLIIKIWTQEQLPADLKDALIVTIYKKKGDRSDCGNYRGISLLSIAGKVLARILNNRLRPIAESILPESQSGFRPSRGTTDMIFSVRQLQEKCREQHQPLYLAFIDLTKAFDSVHRGLLWNILSTIGCPVKFINILKLLHDDMSAQVLVNGTPSPPFKVKSGVKQGCVIAPTLFVIFIATVMHLIKDKLPPGIDIVYRTDGGLFNLSRLRSKNKTSTTSLLDFQYADDNCVSANSEENLQAILQVFQRAYTQLGLDVNLRKTQVLYQPPPREGDPALPSIKLNGVTLEHVTHFPYLGSHLSSSVDIDDEIQYRIRCAGTTFGRLRTRVFKNKDLRADTKLLVYKAVVIPTLLYGSETWTTYRRHLKSLERFHQRCLRSILEISWEDYRTNISVLHEAKAPSVETMVIKSQLRWAGHLVRMTKDRLPKQVFYCQLKEGKRTRGGQKKRFKDQLKQNMKSCNIDWKNWENQALTRPEWRSIIHQGTEHFERERIQHLEEKRRLRKERTADPNRPKLPPTTTCPQCGKVCASRLGLYSHQRIHP